MPNWCSTCIVFYSENKEQLAAMQKRFTEIVEGDATQENGFGKGWLGDFANTFYPKIGALNIECRGSCDPISEIEHNDKFDCFRMWTMTAWTAKIGLFYKITQDFYPDVKIAYVSEEGGCEYYCKWDPDDFFFVGEYYVDACYPLNKEETEYIEEHEYSSMEEIWEWLDKTMPFKVRHFRDEGKQERAWRNAMDKYINNDPDSDCFCVIAKYYEMPPCEFSFKFQ